MDYSDYKKKWQMPFDQTLMSEKLDGIRAFWDGKQFLSRTNKPFAAPTWFHMGFTTKPLDGELWIERGKFEDTASIVMKKDPHEGWKRLKYMVYDFPGYSIPFDSRLELLQAEVEKIRMFNRYIEYLPHQLCHTEEAMEAFYHNVIEAGGEGLMLKNVNCPVKVSKTSRLCVKYKKFYDMEGVVIGYTPGKGKYEGMMGNLLVKLDNGKQVSIGTGFSDEQRTNPPAIGKLITFSYQSMTNHGNPRFPAFMRERLDPVPKEE